MTKLNAPHFQNADKAREYVEAIRWPHGPVCGHCGETTLRYATKRAGRYRCANPACRKDYSVTTGTVMESSHIKLHVWLQAFYLLSASKKGMSAHQLHRTLSITYKSAWFLHHRIMEAMRAGGFGVPPMGGAGSIVEADETYFGNVEEPRMVSTKGRKFIKKGKASNKRSVVALVERGGEVRTFHVPRADGETVAKIVRENVARETRLMTDESPLYRKVGAEFSSHETVRHSAKEYVRGDIHTNTIEGYFGIFKRGMKGVYQHCAEKNLHRYLAEFSFRYNTRKISDTERTDKAVKGAIGKRLTYDQPNRA